ncbi:MAG: DNA gyrase subunit A [bacterium]|nr:DNA gyrase subunit A [bacterium]
MADIGKIKKREIIDEMQESYIDYAMSVIVSRALPDVRDGLKPVHRRILYAMHDIGLRHAAKYRKSAQVVGEVLGKYHPHGDVAVYDTLARMAQSFSLRYPLIDGQGNFGSIDGDNPAAMRYTECRLASIAEEELADIEKDTVTFLDNYDGSKKEPQVLPARIPQLLLNGTVGIAVGMATSIPPHNLSEVVDACVHLARHPKSTVEDLLQFIQGPDFPTGAIIYNRKGIQETYAQGRGPILMRAVAEIEEAKKGNYRIVVTQIPYQVNKSEMLVHIADLVKEKKIEGIRDIRDESDKDGIRVVFELKHDAHAQKVLNQLYKHSDLQKTFYMNMLALAGGIQPQVMSLKSVLQHFIDFRKVVVERRAKFDLARARERAHILEGLSKALDHIDAVISVIKKSESKEAAHEALKKKFGFSDPQAASILEMRLQTLAGLEHKKITDELKEKRALIKSLEELLENSARILSVVIDELLEVKKKYGDERRTKVVAHDIKEFKEEDLIVEEEVIITLTESGYIKRLKPDAYRVQRRGGKGVIGMEVKEEDVVKNFLSASSHDGLLFFTNRGRVFQTKVYEIPEFSRTAKGQAIVNFLDLPPKETVSAIVPIRKKNLPAFLVMVTKHGTIKKTVLDDFSHVRRSGIAAIKLDDTDSLRWVKGSSGTDDIILVSALGQAIRFGEKDVRGMGRTAGGVRGIRLKKTGDEVVGMGIIENQKSKIKNQNVAETMLLVVSENGYGKRTDIKQYKVQGRGGSGMKTANVTSKIGKLIGAEIVDPEHQDLVAISKKGQVIRTGLGAVSVLGRATQGVRIMKMDGSDTVASITTL